MVSCAAGPSQKEGLEKTSAHRMTVKVADVPPPPGIDPIILTPYTDELLARARMPLEEILPTLAQPAYLTPADPPPARPTAEPPPEAQRRYMRGRQAWHERRGADAVNDLRAADALYPNSPDIIQLLGQIYTTSGNRVRGSYYLEQAVRLNPDDVESLFFLGRFATEQERWDQAITTFARALSLCERVPDVDPALKPLLEISLAGALDRDGYDSAAIRLYTLFLTTPPNLNRTSKMVRELMVLSRQQALVWQAVGDGLNRMGDPVGSLEAYANASAAGDADPVNLTSRVVYTHLRLGQPQEARAEVIARLDTQGVSPQTLALVRYLADRSGGAEGLVAALRPWYESKSRPSALALTLGELMPPEQARAFWREHLTASPDDADVFQRLVTQVFDAKPPDPAAVLDAVHAAVAIVGAAPAETDRVVETLTTAAGDQSSLLVAIDTLLKQPGPVGVLEYFHGRALILAGRRDDAFAAWRRSMEAQPTLIGPRVDLARAQLAQSDIAGALQTLEPIKDRTEPEVVMTRARLLQMQGQSPDALRLLNSAIAQQPLNTSLIVQKAFIQLEMGDPLSAEQTLLEALDRQPRAEVLYRNLFHLYNIPGVRPDVSQQVQRLLQRLMANLPQSRLAKLLRAQILISEQRFDVAEALLQGMLTENPRDVEVLEYLLKLMVRANRREEADALLDKRLEESPRDSALLNLAAMYYRSVVNDRVKYEAVALRILETMPPSADRSVELSRIMTRRKQYDKAKEYLREAIAQFPDDSPRLMYQLSFVLDLSGDKPGAEQLLGQILEKHPDFANANNGLGYSWANRGVKLDESLKLISRAVDAEPDNAAYLDSMGWVYYKLARFNEAITWLRRSASAPGGDYPVILDHLGDALYRNGMAEEAAEAWRRAQQQLRGEDPENDSELVGLEDRLRGKLDALSKGQAAPVAPLGEGVVPPKAAVPQPVEVPVPDPEHQAPTEVEVAPGDAAP